MQRGNAPRPGPLTGRCSPPAPPILSAWGLQSCPSACGDAQSLSSLGGFYRLKTPEEVSREGKRVLCDD